MGRLDHQVKIRGFRIELNEIENALTALPELAYAFVMAREDRPGDQRLAAYVVPHVPGDFDVSATRAALLRSLPSYMVPGNFVVLERLPLNANGKVDRNALPAPDTMRSERTFESAQGSSEEKLAAIWSQVLHLERISVLDNFFELGGHSLLAVQVLSKAGSEFGVRLPIETAFNAQTVRDMAHHIDELLLAQERAGKLAALPDGHTKLRI
ncbi:MAG TPA: phosphopantetheine-binding protein [Noviherbaspirillum sp.]